MTPIRPAPSRWPFRVGAYLGAAVILGGAAALLRKHAGPASDGIHPLTIVGVTVATALAMAWGLAMAALAFRRMDEYLRAGSKFAWYWGGSLGLAASAPLYAFIGLGGLHWLFPQTFAVGRDLFHAFVLGYALPFVTMAGGLLIAWLYWRFSTR
jgi:hypothetical protein